MNADRKSNIERLAYLQGISDFEQWVQEDSRGAIERLKQKKAEASEEQKAHLQECIDVFLQRSALIHCAYNDFVRFHSKYAHGIVVGYNFKADSAPECANKD